MQTDEMTEFGFEFSSAAAHSLYRIASHLGRIEAIAMVRWKTGMGLLESKNWVERFIDRFEKMQRPGQVARLSNSELG